jgi:hypothetical protein
MSPDTNRKTWNKETMCRAAEVARSGEMGYLKRASKYFLCRQEKLRYVKNTGTSCSPEKLVNVHLCNDRVRSK